ncbi:MAG: hypothetical protein ACSLFF_02370 [Solirubrobacterales bacterium]
MSDRSEMEFRVDALTELRAQFVDALEADVSVPAQAAPRNWRFEPRRAWALSAAAVTVLLLAVAIALLPSANNPTVEEATADVARSALLAQYPPDDWFTYTRTRVERKSWPINREAIGDPRTVREDRRAWLSLARDGLIITERLDGPNSTPVATKYPAGLKYRIGQRRYTRAQLDHFAENPQPLFAEIDRESNAVLRDDPALTKWQILNEALRAMAPPLPPQLRAAMIRELATVPGATVIDADSDPAGRSAVGLQLTAQGVRDRVYFDRASSVTTFSSLTAIVDGAVGIPSVKQGETIESYELQASRAVEEIPRAANEVSQTGD